MLIKLQSPDCNIFIFLLSLYGKIVRMNSLVSTHIALLQDRVSSIRRGLMDRIDRNSRLIAVKGSRGVGKTNFLLDYSKEYHPQDNTCLYVNVNNLFIVNDGLFHFVEHFYKLGGKVLLLDQAHKYPEWDKELRACYDAFPDLQIIFTASSIVRIKSNAYLKGIVDMYNLSGLSFREFLELETNQTFPVYSFADMVERHEEIVEDILKHVRPLAYFNNYLEYGYYPIYLEEKSHIDYLLKNINLTLEFDIPYASQIELKYLVKLKQLLYIAAKDNTCNVNISKLSGLIGVSRATVLNYLNYMKNARLLTLLYDTDLAALHKALNPEPMVDDETLSSVYAVPSVRSEVTNIRSHLSEGTVTDFKEKAFQYFSKSQSVSAFTGKEIEAVNQLREGKYIQKEWIYSR